MSTALNLAPGTKILPSRGYTALANPWKFLVGKYSSSSTCVYLAMTVVLIELFRLRIHCKKTGNREYLCSDLIQPTIQAPVNQVELCANLKSAILQNSIELCCQTGPLNIHVQEVKADNRR